VEQDVILSDLKETFENFKILQITDLHEKRFGQDQKKLIDLINKLDYDIIVVTGDIVNNDTKDINPFEDLIKGINKKDLIFFVNGNNDPKVFLEDELTTFGKKLKEIGCILLDKPYAIKRGEDTLWILQHFYNLDKESRYAKEIKDNDIKIGLTHYPMDKETYNEFLKPDDIMYDLVICGHYHGGQVRIPFLGALYINKGGLNG